MSEKPFSRRFNVVVPDVEYYQRLVKCQSACPVRTDSRGYVTAIAAGEYEKAYLIAREANPFVSVCGRICNAPCEAAGACRRGEIDESVAIRALKRFVTERYGTASGRHLPKVRESFEDAPKVEERRVVDQWPGNHGTAQSRSALRKLQERGVNGSTRNTRDIRVAVLGAGPAGLSCAHDLAILGYKVTVFEAAAAWGMMRLGIPEYRLPRDILNLEIQTIVDMGVELRLNTRVDPSLGLARLREEGYQAIFIGIGAHKSRDLRVEGVELDGVLRAVDFLLNVNLGYRVELGDRVVVIGGGPVAFDVARSVRRLGSIQSPATDEDLASAVEVARMALRRGAKEVHMMCLESRQEMPAPEVEIEEGLEEGIVLHTRRGPKRIVGEGGK